MCNAATLEERVAQLEREVAELKQRLGADTTADWIEQIAGSFKDDPEFDEVLRLGAELRRSDVPEDDPS